MVVGYGRLERYLSVGHKLCGHKGADISIQFGENACSVFSKAALEALLCPGQAWQALVADWQPRSCRAFRAVHQHLLSRQAGSSAHGEDAGADALHSHNRCQEDGLHRGGQGIAGPGSVL